MTHITLKIINTTLLYLRANVQDFQLSPPLPACMQLKQIKMYGDVTECRIYIIDSINGERAELKFFLAYLPSIYNKHLPSTKSFTNFFARPKTLVAVQT